MEISILNHQVATAVFVFGNPDSVYSQFNDVAWTGQNSPLAEFLSKKFLRFVMRVEAISIVIQKTAVFSKCLPAC